MVHRNYGNTLQQKAEVTRFHPRKISKINGIVVTILTVNVISSRISSMLLKNYRRISTRYDKLAHVFLAAIYNCFNLYFTQIVLKQILVNLKCV